MPYLEFSISCTTRQPRPGEQNGREYYFLTTEEFEREMKVLRGERRVKRDFDPFGEAMYEITESGKDALMGRG